MKLLVIGATGQLARSLAEIQLDDGYQLQAIGRPEIDLRIPATIETGFTNFAPDMVINVAAYTAVDAAESESELAFGVNADGAGRVAAQCAKAGVPLIHISTDYVFDGRMDRPYLETDRCAPLGVYGKSKLAGERRVLEECSNVIILRSAWIHSPFGPNFVRTMLRLAADREMIEAVSDQIGSPTYAPHLAGAIVSLAKNVLSKKTRDIAWGIYNASGTGEASWFQLAEEVFVQSEIQGGPTSGLRPIVSSAYPATAKRPGNSRLDCNKLAKQFGITLPDWRTGVGDCVKRLCTG